MCKIYLVGYTFGSWDSSGSTVVFVTHSRLIAENWVNKFARIKKKALEFRDSKKVEIDLADDAEENSRDLYGCWIISTHHSIIDSTPSFSEIELRV